MNYIVLDLEWNQPISYHDVAYRETGGQLLFELIQIGAVKLDAQFRETGRFSQLIKPSYYQKLHPRIRRITHIEPAQLEEAPSFVPAMEAFWEFCGNDPMFLTWGCDDISVLYQNMMVFEYQKTIDTMYDLQHLFAVESGQPKTRSGLQNAMEQMQIAPDESMPFHNALYDAYYTALVFRNMQHPEKITDFPLKPKALKHTERHIRQQEAIFHVRNGLKGFLLSPAAKNPPCICCGQHMKIPEGYLPTGADTYCALADCKQHGLSFVYVKNTVDSKGQKAISRSIKLSDEQNRAYVATKHWQWKNKMEALKKEETSP